MLNVIDEFTRECLAIEVHRTIDADDVVNILDRLVAERGMAPGFVRFDNGPEFIAHAVADWCRFNGTASIFIDPGSPWQNAWIESFNGRFRGSPSRSSRTRAIWPDPRPCRFLLVGFSGDGCVDPRRSPDGASCRTVPP